MEEYSQAVLEERDSINEQLQLKEAEIEQERILRIELNDRLQELQNKVKEFTVICCIIIVIFFLSELLSLLLFLFFLLLLSLSS